MSVRLLALLILVIVSGGCDSPKNVIVGVEVPIQVKNDDEFDIVASVENTAPEQQSLVSLDIADAYLKGIAILGTEPDYQEASHIPLDNTVSYVFNLPVGAGKR